MLIQGFASARVQPLTPTFPFCVVAAIPHWGWAPEEVRPTPATQCFLHGEAYSSNQRRCRRRPSHVSRPMLVTAEGRRKLWGATCGARPGGPWGGGVQRASAGSAGPCQAAAVPARGWVILVREPRGEWGAGIRRRGKADWATIRVNTCLLLEGSRSGWHRYRSGSSTAVVRHCSTTPVQ
jgi:hypothetical protein